MVRKSQVERRSTGKTPSARQRAYLHIQRRVASGHLKAGTPISEVELASELGSSRTPVREAIGQLIAEGLLEQSPTGGTLVVQLKREDILELYELREALEVYEVGKIVRMGLRRDESLQLQALVDDLLSLKNELVRSGAETLDTDQMNRFITHDLSFHAMLMSMAQNSRIQKVVNDTRLLIRIFACYRRGHAATLLEQIHREHQDLLDAMANNDAERAMQLIAAHVRTSLRDRLQDFDLGKREASMRASIPAMFDGQDDLVKR
jgi:DNA-binding GntR family transcriptional regulator